MKKRLLCIVICCVLVLMTVVLLTGCNKVKPPAMCVLDDMHLLGEDQINSLNATCQKVYQDTGVVMILATCGRSYSSAMRIGEDVLHQLGYGQGDNVIVFIVNASDYQNNYHYDLYTYGAAKRRVKDAEVDAILDNRQVASILASNSAYLGMRQAAVMCGDAYTQRIAGPSLWRYVILGLVLATIVTIVVMVSIHRRYSRKRANVTYSYDDNTHLNLTEHEDRYTHQHTSFVIISSNSRSSGGGHSSGGGGGGGHRGGR